MYVSLKLQHVEGSTADAEFNDFRVRHFFFWSSETRFKPTSRVRAEKGLQQGHADDFPIRTPQAAAGRPREPGQFATYPFELSVVRFIRTVSDRVT